MLILGMNAADAGTAGGSSTLPSIRTFSLARRAGSEVVAERAGSIFKSVILAVEVGTVELATGNSGVVVSATVVVPGGVRVVAVGAGTAGGGNS